MAIKADFHIHSNYSGDGNTSIEEMVRVAFDMDEAI